MKVQELEQLVQQRLAALPARSAALRAAAETAGLPQRFLRQIARGERPIPRAHFDDVVLAVGLTYTVTVTYKEGPDTAADVLIEHSDESS